MTDEERKALVERLRSNRPLPTLPHEAADQIEADGQRIAELEAALRDMVEATERRAVDLGGYDGRFGLNKNIAKARAALGDKQ